MIKTYIILCVSFTLIMIGVSIFGPLFLVGLIYMSVYFLFGIAYFNKVNKNTIKKHPKALSYTIFYLPGLLVALFLALFLRLTAENIAFFPMFLALAAPPAAHWLALRFLRYNEKGLKQEQEAKIRAFYDECVQFGLTETGELTPDKRQRIELLAKKHNIPFDSSEDLQKVVAQFKPVVEDEQRRAYEAEICKLKGQEAAEYKTLTMYANLHGRDKPQTIFHDMSQKEYAFAKSVSYMHTRKESDGAIMAGMAAGIGGPIPALMSLSSTAQHNEAVRAHNEAVNTMNMLYADGVAAATSLGDKYHETELAVATKLVEDGTPGQWMEYLSFKGTKLEVTETGTVIVTTEMFAKPVTIFGNTPAYLDGSVVANIYDGERRIGQATMVFPAYGTNSWVDNCFYAKKAEGFTHRFKGHYVVKYDYCTGVFERERNNKADEDAAPSTSLIGMCLFCGQPGKTYTVQFTPGDLWAIEQ